MATAAIDISPRIRARSELQQMLADLDERIAASELSWYYARRLRRDEWLELREAAARNAIPLRIS